MRFDLKKIKFRIREHPSITNVRLYQRFDYINFNYHDGIVKRRLQLYLTPDKRVLALFDRDTNKLLGNELDSFFNYHHNYVRWIKLNVEKP